MFDNRIVGGNWSATVENRNFRKFDESEYSLIGHFEIIDRVGRFGNDTVDISNVTTARTCSFLRRLPFSFVYSLRASSTSAFPYSVEIRRWRVNSSPFGSFTNDWPPVAGTRETSPKIARRRPVSVRRDDTTANFGDRGGAGCRLSVSSSSCHSPASSAVSSPTDIPRVNI